MVGLKIAGALDRCATFDRPLNYGDISRVTFVSPSQRDLMVENYRAARQAGVDPALILALKRCVAPSLGWKCWRALEQRMRRLAREIDRFVLAGRVRAWHRRMRMATAKSDLCSCTKKEQRRIS